VRDLADLQDGLEFLGPQQRHRRHRDAARLHDGEPAGGQHGVVRRAQQHTVARHQAHVPDQHVGDAVGALLQVGIGPGHAGRPDADAPAASLGHVAVEQFGGAVQALGKPELGQFEQEHRLLFGRRQVVAGEGVQMRGGHVVSSVKTNRPGLDRHGSASRAH